MGYKSERTAFFVGQREQALKSANYGSDKRESVVKRRQKRAKEAQFYQDALNALNGDTKSVPVDERLGEMLCWAVRYSIGRMTYAPSDTVDFIRPLVSALDARTLNCILHDINDAYDKCGLDERWKPLGDRCDEIKWLKLRELIMKTMSERGIQSWK